MTTIELLVLGTAAAVTLFGIALANVRLSVTILMSLACFTMTWNDVRAASFTISDYLLFATIGLVLISPVPIHPIRKLFGGSQKAISIYAGILFAASLIGGILRREPDLGLNNGLRFIASVFIIVFLVSALVTQRRDWERYAMWYVLGATVSALAAMTDRGAISGRNVGLTNHPNHLGLAMLLAFFLAIATQGSPHKLVRYLTAACQPLLVVALVASGSRGALISLAIGFFVFVLLRRGRAVPAMVGVVFTMIVLLVSLPQELRSGPSALGRLLTPTKFEVASGDQRLSLYREAIDLIEANPVLGEGFAQAYVFHSVPLQVLVMGGLAGLAALLILTRVGFSAIRFAAARGQPVLERASGAGLVALAFFLLTEPILFDRYYLFFLSMAFMACSTQLRPEDASDDHVLALDRRTTRPV